MPWDSYRMTAERSTIIVIVRLYSPPLSTSPNSTPLSETVWSNFEIGDLNFWRGEAYMKYFEYLDSKGGFYYERWGDAPVHSIGVSLFANKSQIHFFNDIGYKHDPFQHCPQGEAHKRGRCWCDANQNFGETFVFVFVFGER
jgi:hypothetical protein